VVNEWKEKQQSPKLALRQPNRISITPDTVFFDPVSGNPRLWYWRRDKGDYEFFDGPGFHPQNGQPLESFTRERLGQYQQEIDEKAKQLKAEQERIEADRRTKQEEEAKRHAEQMQREAAEQRQREEATKRLTEASQKCDQLAANPNDARKAADGVSYGDLKPQAAAAVDACEAAVKQNPNELRFQYQLGRALELAGEGPARAKNRQKALEIHQALVRAGYVSAFDNLASIYFWDRKDLETAAVLWRKGIQLGDSDSMLSFADLIDKGRIIPSSPNETPFELYKRAAELGNENGVRAYQAEQAKAQQQQERQVQDLEQQRMMLQFMGTVLRNVR
jgi:hypothetical protein